MNRRETVAKEVSELNKEGAKLAYAFQEKKEENFQYVYQAWYTKTLRAISIFASDRLLEFRGYYEINPQA